MGLTATSGSNMIVDADIVCIEGRVTMDNPKFMTVSETAKALNVSEITIRRMVARHEMPHLKIAGALRIPTQWVDRMVDESMKAAE